MIETFFGYGFVALIIWILHDYYTSLNQPPGPMRIPFFGSVIQVALAGGKEPYNALHNISKKYGKRGIVRIQIGFLNTVIISDIEAMKEILGNESANSRSFTADTVERNMGLNTGVIFSEGEPWTVFRRFVLKSLRDCGLSQRAFMQEIMQEEVEDIITRTKQMFTKDPVTGKESVVARCHRSTFSVNTINILLRIMVGQRFSKMDDAGSPSMRFLAASIRFIEGFSPVTGIYNYWPFLKYLAPELSGYTLSMDVCRDMQNIANDLIEESETTANTNPGDAFIFVDKYLEKIQSAKTNQEDAKFFSKSSFIVSVIDLMQAGSDTTANVLSYSILFLAKCQDVQNKLLEEFENVVGKGNRVDLSFRERMPYMQAFTLEVLRWGRTVTTVPRKAKQDLWYQGYLIKQGTAIITNLHSLFMGPDIWQDPYNFRPERFLKANDNGELKIVKELADKIAPFGSGRRLCPGEGTARDAIFIIILGLVSVFEFSLLENDDPDLEPIFGFASGPKPFSVKTTLRT